MHALIKRVAIAAAAVAAVAAAGYYGHEYWSIGRFLQSTNDAYLQADLTPLAEGHDHELPRLRRLSRRSVVEQRIYRAIERNSCDGHNLLADHPREGGGIRRRFSN